jgi:hypothetical protein
MEGVHDEQASYIIRQKPETDSGIHAFEGMPPVT